MNQEVMQAGRARARERRRLEAVERIASWEEWCRLHAISVKYGAKAPPMPDVPRASDYRLMAQ